MKASYGVEGDTGDHGGDHSFFKKVDVGEKFLRVELENGSGDHEYTT